MKRIVLLAFLLISASASAITYTTSGCGGGNWRTVAAWNDGTSCGHSATFPVEADTVTINGGVTITIPNAEVDKAGGDPANGTTLNITVTGSGSTLAVANGGQLEAHSSILITTNGSFTLGTGNVLTWATTNVGAPIYSLQFQGVTPPLASLTMTGTNAASVGFQTATLSVIDVAAVNPTAYWNMTSVSFASNVSLTWALLQHCGSKTAHVQCAKLIGGITTNHALFNLSSGIWVTGAVAADNNIRYMHVRNTQDEGAANNNFMLFLNALVAQGGNVRQLTHSTFYNPSAQTGDASILIQEAGLTASDVVALISFNIVNSSSSAPDLITVNGLAQGIVSTSDVQPFMVTTPGAGVSMSNVVVAEDCHAAGSVGQANVLREGNINTVGAAAVSNRYTDWMVFGPTRTGCNTNNGNWGGYVFHPGDTFPGGATLSTAGAVLKQVGAFHTAGSLTQNLISGTQFVNTYTTIRNATVYDNITATSAQGEINIEGGSTTSANKVLELSTIWIDSSNAGITPGLGVSYVPQTTLVWENNNFTNPASFTALYLKGWNANKNIAGSICYSNNNPSSCFTQDGTATVSSTAAGPPCVLTISGLTGVVNVGDYAFKAGGNPGLAVTAVSGSNITLGYDTAGSQSCGNMVATNTVLFGKSYWAAGTNYYGQPSTTGYGASDSALQPNFPNPTAAIYTWSTMRGGAGTLDDARNRWATYVDGIPLDGDNCPNGSAPAPYCTAQTPGDSWQDFSAWAHWSFTIYNGRAAHSGYLGIDPGVNGVYNPTAVN